MRRNGTMGAALALLAAAAPAPAGPFHHGGCCGGGEGPQPQYSIKAQVEERV